MIRTPAMVDASTVWCDAFFSIMEKYSTWDINHADRAANFADTVVARFNKSMGTAQGTVEFGKLPTVDTVGVEFGKLPTVDTVGVKLENGLYGARIDAASAQGILGDLVNSASKGTGGISIGDMAPGQHGPSPGTLDFGNESNS